MHILKNHSFYVVGISDRTSNAKELAGSGVIGRIWHDLFSKSLLSRISNRIDNDIIAVYSDYERGKDADYTFLLGARVANIDHATNNMTAYIVPAQKYTVFTSEKGQRAEVEVALWKYIWSLEDSGKLDRAYKADYVVYDERSCDPAHAIVDIYIGIK